MVQHSTCPHGAAAALTVFACDRRCELESLRIVVPRFMRKHVWRKSYLASPAQKRAAAPSPKPDEVRGPLPVSGIMANDQAETCLARAACPLVVRVVQTVTAFDAVATCTSLLHAARPLVMQLAPTAQPVAPDEPELLAPGLLTFDLNSMPCADVA